MPLATFRRTAGRLLALGFFAALLFGGCTCVDQQRAEEWGFGADSGSTDILTDTRVPPPDAEPPLDIADTAPPIDTWQPEDVVRDINCTQDALTDRTSTIVDRQGTTWVGFHRYQQANCNNPVLVVARKPLGGTWTFEDIQAHAGIFGLSSIDPGRPIMVYPDPFRDRRNYGSGTFRVAHREGARNWNIREYNVGNREVGPYAGFDTTEDGESFWSTFAYEDGQMVQLFEYDTTDAQPKWEGRAPLPMSDPRPALARGLRANTQESVYLVFQEDENEPDSRFGVARYDKTIDSWPQREKLDDVSELTFVHSFIVRQNSELCLSSIQKQSLGSNSGTLLVTCGSMADLEQDVRRFPNQRVPANFPASITEGDDGTLYVAFHPPANNELRLAKREPGANWSVQTIFEGPTYGISTAIDRGGDLVLSFYTCKDRGECSLKVLRERPDEL